MEEKTLFKIALSIAVAGIIGLFFLSEFAVIEERRIVEIEQGQDSSQIRIRGYISGVENYEDKGFSRLSIEQKENIDVLLFDNINISKGDKVDIFGTIDDENSEKTIIADIIRKS